MGARTSSLYLKHVAACTTAVGRSMIIQAKAHVEGPECGGHVVYGDSVAGYTPVPIRVGGEGASVMIDTVENVATLYGDKDGWTPCVENGRQDKESIELQGVEVWSDKGWTRAHRLIRHVLAPHKRMVRVTTQTGVVDVTDEHSLLRPDNTAVKPTDTRPGELLMHRDLPELTSSATYGEEARIMSVLDGGGHVDLKSHESAATFFARVTSLGYVVSVDTPKGPLDPTLTRLKVCAKCSEYSERDMIKRIDAIDHVVGAYVYDFTTDNHTFAAGVGRMIVHNTDSIFIVFPRPEGAAPRDVLAKAISQGQAASRSIKPLLRVPHNLEYEKTMFPLILLSKKR